MAPPVCTFLRDFFQSFGGLRGISSPPSSLGRPAVGCPGELRRGGMDQTSLPAVCQSVLDQADLLSFSRASVAPATNVETSPALLPLVPQQPTH